jgi:hypothetical protein
MNKPILSVLVLFGFVFYAAAISAFQTPQSGKIEGTITDLHSGRLLLNAAISFSGSAAPIRGFTDGSGRFAFENVPADEYRVTISQDGYVWSKKESGPEMVTLKPGQEIRGLSFRMLKPSAISGRIVDRNGDPARVSVTLLSVDYRNGRRGLVTASGANAIRGASTNRNGEYRIYGVEPGEYYLRSELEGLVYYPGVSDVKLALPITVLPGRDATADLQMPSIQAHSVSVTLSESINAASIEGRILDTSTWFIAPRDPAGLVDFSTLSSMRFTPVGGNRYQSARLPPGVYELYFAQQSQMRFGHLVFNVKDRDEDLGTLTLTPGISLNGRVRLADFPAESMPIQVNLVPANGTNLVRAARPQDDGTFTVLNVPEGNYFVTFTGMPQDAYIQSLRYGSIPNGNADIVIGRAPEGSLDITLAKGAAVKGTVRNTRGDGIPKGQVVVFPTQDRKQNPMFLKTAETDESGSFSIQGLAPGEYRALAWEDVLPRLAKDPGFLSSLGQRGTRFTILQSSTATVDVPVLSPSN